MTDHTNADDLLALAKRMQALTLPAKITFVTYAMHTGLMIPKGFSARFLWLAVRFGAWLHGKCRFEHYALVLSANQDGADVARENLDQTVTWMIHGKDTTDPRSAGGLNAKEIALIEDMVARMEREERKPHAA